jgi:hypothetical protein
MYACANGVRSAWSRLECSSFSAVRLTSNTNFDLKDLKSLVGNQEEIWRISPMEDVDNMVFAKRIQPVHCKEIYS